MDYLFNEETEAVLEKTADMGRAFDSYPWREATQAERDAYLLGQAKDAKNKELQVAFHAFLLAGYECAADIICDTWDSETTYSIKELAVIEAPAPNLFRSKVNGNQGNAPASSPDEWEVFDPVFNLDDCSILCMNTQRALGAGATDRYKFYCAPDSDNYRNQIDFGGDEQFEIFALAYLAEKVRVMDKYNYYFGLIMLCLTVAAVDAIEIDFSA